MRAVDPTSGALGAASPPVHSIPSADIGQRSASVLISESDVRPFVVTLDRQLFWVDVAGTLHARSG